MNYFVFCTHKRCMFYEYSWIFFVLDSSSSVITIQTMTVRDDNLWKLLFSLYRFEAKKSKFVLLIEYCFLYWISKMPQSVKNDKVTAYQIKSVDFYQKVASFFGKLIYCVKFKPKNFF